MACALIYFLTSCTTLDKDAFFFENLKAWIVYSYLVTKAYVEGIQWNPLAEMIPMSTYNICFCGEKIINWILRLSRALAMVRLASSLFFMMASCEIDYEIKGRAYHV